MMKTIPALFAAMAMLTNAWAAKDIDLTKFDGAYKGSGMLTALGQTFPLTAKVKFDVAKDGSTAKVKMSGVVTATKTTPWGTTLTLKRNGRMRTSDLVALPEETDIVPATGTYVLPKNSKLVGRTTVALQGQLGQQNVTMVVKPRGKTKKKLDLTLLVLLNGAVAFTFDMTLTGK